jgi:hypothetical protein
MPISSDGYKPAVSIGETYEKKALIAFLKTL